MQKSPQRNLPASDRAKPVFLLHEIPELNSPSEDFDHQLLSVKKQKLWR
jgi:hypothetical protein